MRTHRYHHRAVEALLLGGWKLLDAAGKGQADRVKQLLDKGAHKNETDEQGRTPLCRAAQGGHVAVVRLLVGAGVDRERRDQRGLTALDLAKSEAHGEIVALLQTKQTEAEEAAAEAAATREEVAESVLDLAGVEDYEALDKVTAWLKEKKLSTLKELAGLASAAFEPARPTRALYAGRDLLTAPCVSDRANSRPWQRVPI